PQAGRKSAYPTSSRQRCNSSPGELGVEIQRARADRRAAGHRPEDLELEAVRILRVKRQTRPVIRLTDQRPGLDQPLARPREIAQLCDFPCRVVHARGALVGRLQAGLFEEAEMMIVRRARDDEERGVRILALDLEAEHVAVE